MRPMDRPIPPPTYDRLRRGVDKGRGQRARTPAHLEGLRECHEGPHELLRRLLDVPLGDGALACDVVTARARDGDADVVVVSVVVVDAKVVHLFDGLRDAGRQSMRDASRQSMRDAGRHGHQPRALRGRVGRRSGPPESAPSGPRRPGTQRTRPCAAGVAPTKKRFALAQHHQSCDRRLATGPRRLAAHVALLDCVKNATLKPACQWPRRVAAQVTAR